ncbi:MAG: Invasion associated locus B family protein [Xanthobacteraceae bacterium]|nr:MAG: Invasion associated locus B family protein [Xanthobacteraceae bacterium]
MFRPLTVFATAVAAAWVLGIGAASAQTAKPRESAKQPAKQSAKPAAKPRGAPAKPAAVAAAGGAQPTLIAQYGSWGAYTASPNGRKVCFALAKPTSARTNPANRPRDPSYAFISTRPAEKVRDEVSVMIGYPFKPGFEASLEVAGTRFALYTQGDGAWIKNAAEETRMVEAMRKGTDAVIKGQSSRGTETTDTFSMKGLAQALDRLAQDCR